MYDFYEFLGRGIIAARTGRPAEAVKYLSIAEKIEPGNVRVWLWLATVVGSFAEKRQCLERALELAPDTLAAKVLLERLDQKKNTAGQKPADMVVFTCPSCGGKQHFDPDFLALVCDFCKQAETLTPANAFKAEIDLAPTLWRGSGNWAMLESQVACSACGAKISVPAERSLQACPFCASEHIVAVPATPGLIPPTAIAPFEIHSGDVRDLLRKWWRIPFLAPAHLLDVSNEAVTLAPIYLPFWTFDGRVQIRCKLSHNVQPQEYSKKDRVITIHDDLFLETGSKDWNWYECDIDDLLIYAAHSIQGKDISQITPFNLQALLAYQPAMLAGWQAELYQVALEDAAVQANKQMRDSAFGSAALRMLFMEPNHMLENDVRILNPTFKLVLLPVWLVRYTFRNQTYQALVNGQSGKIAGERPLNWMPVWLAALALSLLAMLGLLLRR